MITKAALTAVFEALGPERVARGLEANGHTWHDCFLAVATGESHSLAGEIKRRWWTDAMAFLSGVVGASPRAINAVVREWDRDDAAFRAVATEWLEHHCTFAERLS